MNCLIYALLGISTLPLAIISGIIFDKITNKYNQDDDAGEWR